jgi:hypothetical protein
MLFVPDLLQVSGEWLALDRLEVQDQTATEETRQQFSRRLHLAVHGAPFASEDIGFSGAA